MTKMQNLMLSISFCVSLGMLLGFYWHYIEMKIDERKKKKEKWRRLGMNLIVYVKPHVLRVVQKTLCVWPVYLRSLE